MKLVFEKYRAELIAVLIAIILAPLAGIIWADWKEQPPTLSFKAEQSFVAQTTGDPSSGLYPYINRVVLKNTGSKVIAKLTVDIGLDISRDDISRVDVISTPRSDLVIKYVGPNVLVLSADYLNPDDATIVQIRSKRRTNAYVSIGSPGARLSEEFPDRDRLVDRVLGYVFVILMIIAAYFMAKFITSANRMLSLTRSFIDDSKSVIVSVEGVLASQSADNDKIVADLKGFQNQLSSIELKLDTIEPVSSDNA